MSTLRTTIVTQTRQRHSVETNIHGDVDLNVTEAREN